MRSMAPIRRTAMSVPKGVWTFLVQGEVVMLILVALGAKPKAGVFKTAEKKPKWRYHAGLPIHAMLFFWS